MSKKPAKKPAKKASRLEGHNWAQMAAFGRNGEFAAALKDNNTETLTGKNDRYGMWKKKAHGKGTIGKAANIKSNTG